MEQNAGGAAQRLKAPLRRGLKRDFISIGRGTQIYNALKPRYEGG